ncbi:Uncharacterised protein [Mycobacteroides abscessus subsp. abscessus]|nr:Uncharacterised protein [Mycobacteroides abscessus subsp. abscessus]
MQQDQVEGGDAAVGGGDRAETAPGLFAHPARVDAVLAGQAGETVLADVELGADAGRGGSGIALDQASVVRQGDHAGLLLGASAGDEGVGVVHRRHRRPQHAVFGEVGGSQLVELGALVGDGCLVAEVVDPAGAGVVVGDVDLAVQLGVAQAVGALDVGQVAHVGAGRRQREFDEVAENVLFGEVLGADGDRDTVEFGHRADAARSHAQRHRAAGLQSASRGQQQRGDEGEQAAGHVSPRGPRNSSASAPSQSTSSASATASTAPTTSVTVSRSL